MPIVQVELIVLYKDGTWKEKNCSVSMKEGSDMANAIPAAVNATMSNLAATGELEKIHSIAYSKHNEQVRIEDAPTH